MRTYLLQAEDCSALCPELIRALRAHGIEASCCREPPQVGNERSAAAIVALDAKSIEPVLALREAHPRTVTAAILELPEALPSELIDRAYAELLGQRFALIGAHSQDRFAVLTGERGVFCASTLKKFTNDFALVLASRIGQAHYRTRLEPVQKLPVSQELIDETLTLLRESFHLALFPRYEAKAEHYPRAEFGFLARRTDKGTLITTRASNKEAPGLEDLAVISAITRAGEIHALSLGRKPSLNGPLAHEIFALRPEINWVLHAHVFLPAGCWTKLITAPGTLEDWGAVLELVKAGERLINQPLHGTLILLERAEELLPLLQAQGLYHERSELYEIAYARFQDREGEVSSFEEAVRSLALPTDTSVLDLCCGTGASTRVLKKHFTQVDFADAAPAMLSLAEREFGTCGIPLKLPDLTGLKDHQYDLMTLRQAFNYLSPCEMTPFFEGALRHLRPGGYLIFNTFEPHPKAPRANMS